MRSDEQMHRLAVARLEEMRTVPPKPPACLDCRWSRGRRCAIKCVNPLVLGADPSVTKRWAMDDPDIKGSPEAVRYCGPEKFLWRPKHVALQVLPSPWVTVGLLMALLLGATVWTVGSP